MPWTLVQWTHSQPEQPWLLLIIFLPSSLTFAENSIMWSSSFLKCLPKYVYKQCITVFVCILSRVPLWVSYWHHCIQYMYVCGNVLSVYVHSKYLSCCFLRNRIYCIISTHIYCSDDFVTAHPPTKWICYVGRLTQTGEYHVMLYASCTNKDRYNLCELKHWQLYTRLELMYW